MENTKYEMTARALYKLGRTGGKLPAALKADWEELVLEDFGLANLVIASLVSRAATFGYHYVELVAQLTKVTSK